MSGTIARAVTRALTGAAFAALATACGHPAAAPPDAHGDAAIPPLDAAVAHDPCVGSVAIDDFIGCFLPAYCAHAAACGWGQPDDTRCVPLDFYVLGSITVGTFAARVHDSVASGRAVWDPVAAAACIAGISAMTCPTDHYVGVDLSSCGMLLGRVPVDHGCRERFECDRETSCVAPSPLTYSDACGPDVCERTQAIGASCVHALCGPGDHCVGTDPSIGTAVCLAGDAGAPCNGPYDCDPGLGCDYPATAPPGQALGACAPVTTTTVGVGERCAIDGIVCAAPLACVLDPASYTYRCVDVSEPGAPCGDWCSHGLSCVYSAAAGRYRCISMPALGDPCPDRLCRDDLFCDDRGTADPTDDVCAPLPGPGEPCDNGLHRCHAGLLCSTGLTGRTTGTCLAPLPLGFGCTQDDECASSACQTVCVAPTACAL